MYSNELETKLIAFTPELWDEIDRRREDCGLGRAAWLEEVLWTRVLRQPKRELPERRTYTINLPNNGKPRRRRKRRSRKT